MEKDLFSTTESEIDKILKDLTEMEKYYKLNDIPLAEYQRNEK
jgi:hypothetical protein